MVTKKISNGTDYFMCEACNMYYLNKELAQQCEDFCNKNKSCSIIITNQAVDITKLDQ